MIMGGSGDEQSFDLDILGIKPELGAVQGGPLPTEEEEDSVGGSGGGDIVVDDASDTEEVPSQGSFLPKAQTPKISLSMGKEAPHSLKRSHSTSNTLSIDQPISNGMIVDVDGGFSSGTHVNSPTTQSTTSNSSTTSAVGPATTANRKKVKVFSPP